MIESVPWASTYEWIDVFSQIIESEEQSITVSEKLTVWARSKACPGYIEATAALLECIKYDRAKRDVSEFARRMMYSAAIMRLVNLVSDVEENTSVAQNIRTTTMPSYFVDVRHAISHSSFPQFILLEQCIYEGFRWILDAFWIPQFMHILKMFTSLKDPINLLCGLIVRHRPDKIDLVIEMIRPFITHSTLIEFVIPYMVRFLMKKSKIMCPRLLKYNTMYIMQQLKTLIDAPIMLIFFEQLSKQFIDTNSQNKTLIHMIKGYVMNGDPICTCGKCKKHYDFRRDVVSNKHISIMLKLLSQPNALVFRHFTASEIPKQLRRKFRMLHDLMIEAKLDDDVRDDDIKIEDHILYGKRARFVELPGYCGIGSIFREKKNIYLKRHHNGDLLKVIHQLKRKVETVEISDVVDESIEEHSMEELENEDGEGEVEFDFNSINEPSDESDEEDAMSMMESGLSLLSIIKRK
ncbi:hypothetical protein PCE1_000188 [Barthelona sp. PCE]